MGYLVSIICDSLLDYKPQVKTDIEDLLRQQVAESHPAKSRHGSTSSRPGAKKKIRSKSITSKTVQWPSLPPNKLGVMSPGKKTRVNAIGELTKEKPISRKSTVVHEEVIRSRDLVFEVHIYPPPPKMVASLVPAKGRRPGIHQTL